MRELTDGLDHRFGGAMSEPAREEKRHFNNAASSALWAGATDETILRFRSPHELLEQSTETVPWLLEGYIARGAITILGGREKAGKTTLAWSMVKALVDGEPSFIGARVNRTSVVYLSEEPDATLIEKVQRWGLAHAGDRLRIVGRQDIRGKRRFDLSIRAALEEAARVGAELLVVDTMAFWAAMAAEEENQSGAVQAAFGPLFEATSKGLAVLVLHHLDKARGELRGSTALGANADIIMTLIRDPSVTNRRKIGTVGRFSQTPESVVLEFNGRAYSALGTPSDVGFAARRDKVLGALPEEVPGLTLDELATALDLSKPRVSDAVNQLKAEGLVIVEGAGKRGDPYRVYRNSTRPPAQP